MPDTTITPTVTPAVMTELETHIADAGLAPDGAVSLRDGYAPYFARWHAVRPALDALTSDDVKQARELRLTLKAIRCDAEKTRKDLKADVLRRGRAIDGLKHLLDYQLVPSEQRCQDIELAEQRRQEAERRARYEARCGGVAELGGDPQLYALSTMTEEEYTALLAMLRADRERREREEAEARAREEAERRAREEAERQAREEAARQAAEREAEIARLRAEAEERERQQAEERREREAAEEAARKAQEALRRERERARRAKLRAEREAAAAAAAEEERRRAEREAPDRDRLAAVAAAVRAIEVPALPDLPGYSAQAAAILEDAACRIVRLAEGVQA